MPCTDGGFAQSDYYNLKKRLDDVTALLCAQCQASDAAGHALPPDVATWWEAHKEADLERVASEYVQTAKQLAHKATKIRDLGGEPSEWMQLDMLSAIASAHARIALMQNRVKAAELMRLIPSGLP